MRTHRAKTEYLPPSIFRIHFRLVPPPPFPQVDGGGCYREKFLFFFWFVIVLVWFWLSDYRLIISIFIFLSWLVLAMRDYLLRLVWFSLDIPCLFFVMFSSHQFRLVSALFILCFNSSTLYLFDSSACYKQTFMLMWVCFMLVLAILRLSDVFLFVLGVVYCLWLK